MNDKEFLMVDWQLLQYRWKLGRPRSVHLNSRKGKWIQNV
jgi:hypothetical protein